MKILIVATAGFSTSYVGSIRPTELAKIFYEKGHEVVYLTNRMEDSKYTDGYEKYKDKIKVIEVEDDFLTAKDISFGAKLKRKFSNHRLFEYLFFEFLWAKKAQKKLLETYDKNYFDIVFSTSPRAKAHRAAMNICENTGTVWVCDFRDLLVQTFQSSLINTLLKTRQNEFIKKANAVTLVSRDSLKQIKSEGGRKLFFVPNGYDGEPQFDNTVTDDKLRFTYTGILYNGRRDLSIFFDALRRLINKGDLERNRIRVSYAGPDGKIMKEQAQKFKLYGIVEDLGIISQAEARALQKKSHFLLISSWNTPVNMGVIPAKIYEYMSAGKPVISIVSGGIPGAELSSMVDDMRLGIALEGINYENSVVRLMSYIREQINCVDKTGSVKFEPNREKMKAYKRENIGEHLLKIFEDLRRDKNA